MLEKSYVKFIINVIEYSKIITLFAKMYFNFVYFEFMKDSGIKPEQKDAIPHAAHSHALPYSASQPLRQ